MINNVTSIQADDHGVMAAEGLAISLFGTLRVTSGSGALGPADLGGRKPKQIADGLARGVVLLLVVLPGGPGRGLRHGPPLGSEWSLV